jgi:hypothetical protein
MKILITENKLYRTIYNYLEDTFDVSNIDYLIQSTNILMKPLTQTKWIGFMVLV